MKDKHWQPWIDIVDNMQVCWALRQVPDDMKAVVAACLSVAKWHPSRGEDVGEYGCGLCANNSMQCGTCPLFIKGQACTAEGTYYERWARSDTEADEQHYAAKMYQVLLEIYEEEHAEMMRGMK